jgi:hypothetical protein
VHQSPDCLTQGVIEWRGKFVSYLDEQRLSQRLQRRAIT